MVTDRAVSAFARYDTTLDAVPPGAQPTRIRPAARSGVSPSSLAIAQPSSGMIAYWATTPIRIGSGRVSTSLKSGSVRVRPMPNMMMISRVLTCGASPTTVGAKK